MRIGGINAAAVLAAAVAVYVIGFIVYAVLIPADVWMAWEGETAEQVAAVADSRMPFGPVLPLMIALFMAMLFKMGRVAGAATGARWGAVIALASAIPAELYAWVYGTGAIEVTLVDSGHFLVGHLVAGAILGGWR